jgi:hypothetical protein
MEKWILIALIAFILAEVIRSFVDFKVVNRNYKTYAENDRVQTERIVRLEGQVADKDRIIDIQRRVLGAKTEGFDDTALVVTTEGVKILPKGWREKLSII